MRKTSRKAFSIQGIYRMNWFRKVWDWFLCTDPPRSKRVEVVTDLSIRRKREQLRRAYMTGDLQEVRRLTKELAGR